MRMSTDFNHLHEGKKGIKENANFSITNNRHPKGNRARVLLTSVFGPYAQDDEFGSRLLNPMELYHNQITRKQGVFSPRHFHQSWGIMMIQENISAPCTVLDFPTREAFAREITANSYDIIGISSIVINLEKVREMCRLIREKSPGSVIVVGGHVAGIPDLEKIVDADFVVKGEGISWMRSYLGEDPNAPIHHPVISSGFNMRVLGVKIPNWMTDTLALITSVGCPEGCNFCSTSSFFGGKGNMVNFYPTGEELFNVMDDLATRSGKNSFYIIDENFLLQKQRTKELIELMRNNGKSWSLNIFSSVKALKQYTEEELLDLGINFVWIGLESPRASYAKLKESDTMQLVEELKRLGILTLGSMIIGLDHHTPENIVDEVEHIIDHGTIACQFMLYTPLPGTPFYKEMKEQERLLDVDLADSHGQYAFNFKHPAISREESKKIMDWAFQRDFEYNGPTYFRLCRTTFEGWKRFRNHPEPRIRNRFRSKVPNLRFLYPPVLWAMEKMLREKNKPIAMEIRQLRQEIEREFGFLTKLIVRLFGPVVLWIARREEKRLARGQTYEPPTIITRRRWA